LPNDERHGREQACYCLPIFCFSPPSERGSDPGKSGPVWPKTGLGRPGRISPLAPPATPRQRREEGEALTKFHQARRQESRVARPRQARVTRRRSPIGRALFAPYVSDLGSPLARVAMIAARRASGGCASSRRHHSWPRRFLQTAPELGQHVAPLRAFSVFAIQSVDERSSRYTPSQRTRSRNTCIDASLHSCLPQLVRNGRYWASGMTPISLPQTQQMRAWSRGLAPLGISVVGALARSGPHAQRQAARHSPTRYRRCRHFEGLIDSWCKRRRVRRSR
jgi:hypothetical protein